MLLSLTHKFHTKVMLLSRTHKCHTKVMLLSLTHKCHTTVMLLSLTVTHKGNVAFSNTIKLFHKCHMQRLQLMLSGIPTGVTQRCCFHLHTNVRDNVDIFTYTQMSETEIMLLLWFTHKCHKLLSLTLLCKKNVTKISSGFSTPTQR